MRLYKSITYRYWYAEQDKDIENLINEYGKLEEQIDKHVYFETTNPKEIEKNYIPKPKIKEKIEELVTKLKVFEKDIRYCKDRVQARLMNDEIYMFLEDA